MIKIAIHKDLIEILEKINNTASRLLLSLEKVGIDSINLDKDYANFINLSSNDRRKMSIITTSNIIKYGEITEEVVSNSDELNGMDKFFGSTGITSRRTCISPGKVFTKILSKDYLSKVLSARDIEDFSNKYVAQMESNLKFELVKGEDIRKYYNRINYYEGFGNGTLFQSCMSNEAQQRYLDIYVNNSNVGLLVAFHLDGKVAGRALVWEGVESFDYDKGLKDTNPQTITYMDRIYYTTDWIIDKFKNYAHAQGWYSRRKQSNDEEYGLIEPKSLNVVNRKLRIKIENLNHQFYPYLDTLFNISPEENYLSNSISLIKNQESGTMLRQTSGVSEKMWSVLESKWQPKDRCVWIKNKMSYYDKSKCIKSPKIEDYFIHSECIFSALDNEHITPDDDILSCAVTGLQYRKVRMVESKYHGGVIHKKEAVETVDNGTIHKNNASWSKTFKKWFTTTNCIKVESIEDFLPKEVLNKVSEKDFINFLEIMNVYSDIKDSKPEQEDTYIFEF